ncbi:MAG: hypothetical protein U0169_05915 [Polyangiaceae bacterium]
MTNGGGEDERGTRQARRRAWATFALVGALAGIGCSLVVANDPKQCVSNAECDGRGGPFTGTLCSDGVCVVDPLRDAGVDTGTFVDASDGGSACTTNAECIRASGGLPAVCLRPEMRCANLLSADCDKTVGPVDSDDAILVGTLFSRKTGTENAPTNLARQNSVELAVGEFAQRIVGLPGAPGQKPRPLAMIACHDNDDGKRAARHLTSLHVAAVIGPNSSGSVLDVATNVTIPAGTFLITPTATSPAITNLPNKNGLVWRTCPSDAVQALPLKDQIAALESKVRSDNTSVAKVKVLVAYRNDAYGAGLYNALSDVTLNGKPLADPDNAGSIKLTQFDAAGDLAPTVIDTSDVFRPHVIVLLGLAEVVTKLVGPIEARWPQAPTGDAGNPYPRPYYLLSDGGRVQALLDLANGNDGLRTRIRGTVPSSDTALGTAFSLRYQSRFDSSPAYFGMAGSYDALYLVAYGIVASGQKSLTGTVLADAMKRMIGGTKVDVGPNRIEDAVQILAAGGAIDFEGASGPLDFDVSKNEAPGDVDIWCVGKDGSGAPMFESSGRAYRAAANAIAGTYTTCQ